MEWDLDGDGKMTLTGSGFFTTESPEMRALRHVFQDEGDYVHGEYYIFIMQEANAANEPHAEWAVMGDMPRGQHFGFVFRNAVREDEMSRLIAHELGHGIFTLRHTFDREYGAAQGSTNNLMDYGQGMELAAFQWNVMSYPAWITRFDSEEEGRHGGFFELRRAPRPRIQGDEREAQVYINRDVIIEDGNIIPSQTVRWHFHTGTTNEQGEIVTRAGWYRETEYLEIINGVIVGLLILNSDNPIIVYDENAYLFCPRQSIRAWSVSQFQNFISQDIDEEGFEDLLRRNEQRISNMYDRLYSQLLWAGQPQGGAIRPLFLEFDLLTVGVGAVFRNIAVRTAARTASRGTFVAAFRNVAGRTTIRNTDDFLARIPAQFREEVRTAFVDGTKILRFAESDMILYRHIGRGQAQMSYWFSRTMKSPTNAQRLLALPNYNTAEYVVRVRVSRGTPFIEGRVASQAGRPGFWNHAHGGGNQLYFLEESLSTIEVIETIINTLR